MTISLDDVHKVAKLASLRITAEEADQYLESLQDILSLAKQMETVDTESVRPATYCLDRLQRLRIDKVTASNQRERFQKLTSHVQSHFYYVPPIIE